MPEIDFDPTADYYQDLGVSDTASADEVKKAYRQLAKQYHPDFTGGDKAKEQKFKTVSAAYEVVGDAERRELYDRVRTNGNAPSSPGLSGRVSDLADLFNTFFGTNVSPSPPPPPPPPPPSPSSNGRHAESVADIQAKYRSATSSAGSSSSFRAAQAAAQAAQAAAKVAQAMPAVPHTHTNVVDGRIRAVDGSWLRLDGFDVHSDVYISFDRAMLGTVVTVATIDGKSEVRIPAGSSSGRKLRLRGKGRINPVGFTGDHHITVQVEVPDGDLADDERKLLVQLVDKIKRRKLTSS